MQIKIKQKTMRDAKEAGEILRAILRMEEPNDQDKEHLWVIGLNSRNIIEYVELVSLGILNTNLVHPRETFRLAIQKGVASIVIGHNHPTGNPEPSELDLKTTKHLIKAGKILDIEIMDHVIITETETFSFKEKKLV